MTIKYDLLANEQMRKEELETKAREAGFKAIRALPGWYSFSRRLRKEIFKEFFKEIEKLREEENNGKS
jgi:hypothetical protein